MDLEYACKQLDLEMRHAEARLAEKKEQRAQIFAALTDEQKQRVEAIGKPAPPKKPGRPPA